MTRAHKHHALTLEEALADIDLHPSDLTDPVDVNDLMRRYAELDAQERHAKAGKQEIKEVLQAFHDQGLVADKFAAQGYACALIRRTTWQYSPAVKQLQQMEQLEGTAKQQTSCSWTIKEVKTDA